MTPDGTQLPLFRGCGSRDVPEAPTRRERRHHVVRMVEHTPFPRRRAGVGAGVGFTRDLSTSGMCLAVDRPGSVGALLRVIVRAVDGRPALDTIARVTRCERDAGGRFLLGLSFLAVPPAALLPAARAGVVAGAWPSSGRQAVA